MQNRRIVQKPTVFWIFWQMWKIESSTLSLSFIVTLIRETHNLLLLLNGKGSGLLAQSGRPFVDGSAAAFADGGDHRVLKEREREKIKIYFQMKKTTVALLLTWPGSKGSCSDGVALNWSLPPYEPAA